MYTKVETTTQMGLLTETLKFLSLQTGVPFGDLSNHMIVIGDVARAIDMYGSIYGTPTESDFDFLKYDFEGVYELISQIWHEDTEKSPLETANEKASQAVADYWKSVGFKP